MTCITVSSVARTAGILVCLLCCESFRSVRPQWYMQGVFIV